MKIVRIATRQSKLALAQAKQVKDQLQKLAPDYTYHLVPIVTEGDKATDIPLVQVGGKGLFVKALEKALLADEADIAVHSMKDMTVFMPDGLCLGAITAREDPRDALVSSIYRSFDTLPTGATVGTVSLRRHYQACAKRHDIIVKPLRGNINTRLSKLAGGEFQAIILAMAGLVRLGHVEKTDFFLEPLSLADFLPAPGQGAIGVECRVDDQPMRDLLAKILHIPTAICVLAERQVLRRLGGSCLVPVAAYAEIIEEQMGQYALLVRGEVGQKDGCLVLESCVRGAVSEPIETGDKVAESLLARGAGEIIDAYLTD